MERLPLRFLSCVYTIDFYANSVTSNHTHAVVYMDEDRANSWPDSHERLWCQGFGSRIIYEPEAA